MQVTLEEMLAAREARFARQLALGQQMQLPMVSFSMNIPGPVKDTPLIRRGFALGCARLDQSLGEDIRFRRIYPAHTGWEALYAVAMDPLELKRITTAIEDETPLGRLFDMDVLDSRLSKLDRELVNGRSRNCIVCGAPGKGCASRRVHTLDQLHQAARKLLLAHFAPADARRIGDLAVQALVDEVQTTPKPGLVDLRNNGSHRDMDAALFRTSAEALRPYFRRCAEIGQQTSGSSPEQTFAQLRQAGQQAEQTMFAATGGVNTHKGAIFTLGILCGAAGRLWQPVPGWTEQALFSQVQAMTAGPVGRDFQDGPADTAGMKLYREQGIRGIRGEVMEGLPSVANIGLPAYRAGLARGLDANRAGTLTLLELIAAVTDTNLRKRGGEAGARAAAQAAANLLQGPQLPTRQQIEDLDDWFIQRSLSPGGCADLLAAVYFVQSLLEESAALSAEISE